jgi:hypothetical protein
MVSENISGTFSILLNPLRGSWLKLFLPPVSPEVIQIEVLRTFSVTNPERI